MRTGMRPRSCARSAALRLRPRPGRGFPRLAARSRRPSPRISRASPARPLEIGCCGCATRRCRRRRVQRTHRGSLSASISRYRFRPMPTSCAAALAPGLRAAPAGLDRAPKAAAAGRPGAGRPRRAAAAARRGPAFDSPLAAARVDAAARPAPALVPGVAGDPARSAASTRAGLPLSELDLPPLEPIPAWRTERAPRARPPAGPRAACCSADDERLPGAAATQPARRPPGRRRPGDALPRREAALAEPGQAAAGRLAACWRRRGRRPALPRPARLLRPPAGRAAAPVPARRPAGDGGRPGRGCRARPSARCSAPARPTATRTRSPRPPATSTPSRASTTATSPSRTRRWPSASGRSGCWTCWPSMCRLPRPPRRDRDRADAGRSRFYPTNGVGLGHVTRLLAIARRLPAGTSRSSSRPATRWR